MIEQNKLPDRYLVKTNKDHPLWNKFADYINIQNDNSNLLFCFEYYGEHPNGISRHDSIEARQDYKILTLEEWDSIVNSKFILPEKWCCKPNNETEGIIIREWFNTYRV